MMIPDLNETTTSIEECICPSQEILPWLLIFAAFCLVFSPLGAVALVDRYCKTYPNSVVVRYLRLNKNTDEETQPAKAYCRKKADEPASPAKMRSYRNLEPSEQHLCDAKGWMLLDPSSEYFDIEMVAGVSCVAEEASEVARHLDSVDDDHLKLLEVLADCRTAADMKEIFSTFFNHRKTLNRMVGETYWRICLAKAAATE